jgi:hypothetical protein
MHSTPKERFLDLDPRALHRELRQQNMVSRDVRPKKRCTPKSAHSEQAEDRVAVINVAKEML